jgi:hypothetical protein
MNLTNVNTSQYSNTLFSAITLGSSLNNNAVIGYYDDWYILNTQGSTNTTRLGDSRIETLLPNSDAGPNNGTPSTGSSHYAMIDAAQNNGGSNYITIANTSGQEELFGENSLSRSPSTVFAVKVLNIVKKTDAGNCNGNSIIVSNGVSSIANSTPLLTSFSSTVGIFETDPNTSSAWTTSGVNASNAGFKIT